MGVLVKFSIQLFVMRTFLVAEMYLSPKESARFIADNAEHVKVNKETIPALAELVSDCFFV